MFEILFFFFSLYIGFLFFRFVIRSIVVRFKNKTNKALKTWDFIKNIYKRMEYSNYSGKRCEIVDFLIVMDTEFTKRKWYSKGKYETFYKIYPVVRDLEDNELYITYGNDSFSIFYTKFFYEDRRYVFPCAFVFKRLNLKTIHLGDETTYVKVNKTMSFDYDIPQYVGLINRSACTSDGVEHLYNVNANYRYDDLSNYNFYEGYLKLDRHDIIRTKNFLSVGRFRAKYIAPIIVIAAVILFLLIYLN